MAYIRRLNKVSKKFEYERGAEGYITVHEVLQHRSIKGKYNLKDIERVVTSNDKQRFKLRVNKSTNVLEIKANQGHTIQVDDSELTQILEPKYKTVVHGTYFKCWPLIRSEGLSRMRRKHIHLAKGTLNDLQVISGLRKNVQIYIYIDLDKALNDGLKFFESDNGVILTQGNEKGYLEPKYFSKVIEVRTGYPNYTQPQDLITTFSTYGTPKIEKICHRFAVISFKTEDEAKEAIKDTNKVNIYGQFLTVKIFTDKLDPITPKMDFPRSKEKGKIISPRLIDLSGDFHSQLDALLAAVRLQQSEVSALASLYEDLEAVLQQMWPGCVALPFGSITTGLGIKTSDADCFVSVPPNLRYPNCNFVNKAKRALQQYPEKFAELLAIPRANTPIVKFFHVPTETNCDVTFKTPLGAQNSKLVAFLLHADPRLIPMAVVIKYWAKVHGLSGTGKLTNYALTLMVLFYLQQAPVSILPAVEWLQRDRENDIFVDYWNTGFMHDYDQLPKSTNTSSISELLGGFFQYYSTFNFDEITVCPFIGSPVKKELFKDLNLLPSEFELYVKNLRSRVVMPLRFTSSMCVQDPFELCHNVASAITSRLAFEIRAHFRFAATAYDKEKLNNCQDFLTTILLQKPKLPRGKMHPEYRTFVFRHILEAIENPDWKAIIREVVTKVFEHICKLKMSKVESKTNETEGRKKKEKHLSVLTTAIWKRKQFTKLYDKININWVDKETRITEEIHNVEKQQYNIQFLTILTFTEEPRNVSISIKLMSGDVEVFRDFGKFFITIIQTWITKLLLLYLKPDAKKDNKNNPVAVVEVKKSACKDDANKNVSHGELEDSGDVEASNVDLEDIEDVDASNVELENIEDVDASNVELENIEDVDASNVELENIEDVDASNVELDDGGEGDASNVELGDSGDVESVANT